MAESFMASWWGLALFGVFVGIFAGLFGLGGGAVMVPLLVLGLGMGQRAAQGTSLAIILSPAAAPAIWRYHQGGYIDWRMVLVVAPFLLVGSYLGGWMATSLPQAILKLLFAAVLIYAAGYMMFSKLESVGQAAALSMVPVVFTLGLAWMTGVFSVAAKMAAAEPAPAPAATSVQRQGEAGEGTTP